MHTVKAVLVFHKSKLHWPKNLQGSVTSLTLVCMAVLLELQRRPPGHFSMMPAVTSSLSEHLEEPQKFGLGWADLDRCWSGRAFQEQGRILSHHRLTENNLALEPCCTHLGKLIPLLQLPGTTSCCFCLLQSERGNRAGGGLQNLTVQGDTCQGKKQVEFAFN